MNQTLARLGSIVASIMLVSGCGAGSVVRDDAAGDPTPEATPSAGTGPDEGDWSRHRAVKYADDRLDLDINESGPGAVASDPGAKTAVSRDAAVVTARTVANPDGRLAAAVELVVTSPSFGSHEENSATATAVPAMDHTLVWVVVFHVTVPEYSDVQMANDPSLKENPMVGTVDSVVIDATTGKPYFASLG